MSRDCLSSESHEITSSCNDEHGYHRHHHFDRTPADDAISRTSLYSIVDLDHETLIERAAQLATMLDKSARDLRTYAQLARASDGLSISKKRKPRMPPIVTNNLLPITALWQALCVLILTIIDVYDKGIEHTLSYNISLGIAGVFQFVNLCLVFAATVKLTKQYLHKTASTRFFINGYLSMVLLFAGLYMLMYRFRKASFEPDPRKVKFQYSVEVFIRMLNLSISTATLCGAASITGQTWYSALAMSLQMLISFIYFASFLSQVLSPPKPASSHDRKSSKHLRGVYGSL